MEKFFEHFAVEMRRKRQSLGMTQEHLAQTLEIATQSVSNVERRKTDPSLATLLAISEALQLDLEPAWQALRADKLGDARSNAEARLIAAARGLSTADIERVIVIAQALSNHSRSSRK